MIPDEVFVISQKHLNLPLDVAQMPLYKGVETGWRLTKPPTNLSLTSN